MNQFVAFLRGINVGGNTKVPMKDLKKIFDTLGFTNAKTLLNSGNIVFTTSATNVQNLTKTIEEALTKKFGFPISVLLRSQNQIALLVASEPFKDSVVTPQTRLYISFTDTEDIKSVIEITDNKKTTDLMKDIQQKYGKRITTRNWNTVVKVDRLFN